MTTSTRPETSRERLNRLLTEAQRRLPVGATITNRRGTARWNGDAWVYRKESELTPIETTDFETLTRATIRFHAAELAVVAADAELEAARIAYEAAQDLPAPLD